MRGRLQLAPATPCFRLILARTVPVLSVMLWFPHSESENAAFRIAGLIGTGLFNWFGWRSAI